MTRMGPAYREAPVVALKIACSLARIAFCTSSAGRPSALDHRSSKALRSFVRPGGGVACTRNGATGPPGPLTTAKAWYFGKRIASSMVKGATSFSRAANVAWLLENRR